MAGLRARGDLVLGGDRGTQVAEPVVRALIVNVCPSMNLMRPGVSSSALNLTHANMAENDAPWTVRRRNAVAAAAEAAGRVAPSLNRRRAVARGAAAAAAAAATAVALSEYTLRSPRARSACS
jgi:hypothetical protein